MNTTPRRPNIIYFVFSLLPVFGALMLAGCFGSSDSSGGGATTTTVTVPLQESVKNVVLANGVENRITFTYTIPGDISKKGDFSLNLTETLNHVNLSSSMMADGSGRFETLKILAMALVKDALADSASTAQVTAHLSYAGDPEVCSSPNYLGPYTLSGAVGSAVSSNTTSIAPTAGMVNIINAGSFEVCLITVPPVDAYLTVSNVIVDFEECASPGNLDIEGVWTGTYQCTNSGVANESGPVELTITRNRDGSYHYTDGSAAYDGHLCNSKYKFKGGVAGSYTESGTLIFNGNSASKTSHWHGDSVGSAMQGVCTDTLEKRVN